MFGESDTGESPRVPSPWEAIISTSPSPSPPTTLPKLVPEAEQGNIEYKLQLLSPSPARFARLVTQLKWRLLEGGGQAYYELGVADSGALVGLGRKELERTLETLECMAGEIGASVIVVREIEVPRGMRVGVRESGRGRWNGGGSEGESTTTTDEDDTSPSPLTLDVSPSLFAMDADPDVPSLTLASTAESEYSIDLEISTVYKPRPTRPSSSPSPRSSNPASRLPSQAQIPSTIPTKPKWYPKKKHLPPFPHQSQSSDAPDQAQTQAQGYARAHTHGQQAKALHRRLARDRRREEKRRLAAESNFTPNSNIDNACESKSQHNPRIDSQSATAELVHGLQALHVTVESTPLPVPVSASPVSPVLSKSRSASGSASSSPTVPIIDITSPTSPSSSNTITTLPTTTNGKDADEHNDDGVRLIVEALVVRKLSLEEAFLDFGGFSLI
jgi:hypothetical protein